MDVGPVGVVAEETLRAVAPKLPFHHCDQHNLLAAALLYWEEVGTVANLAMDQNHRVGIMGLLPEDL